MTNKFITDLEDRVSEINRLIPSSKMAERRKLQKERADLEDKIRRAST